MEDVGLSTYVMSDIHGNYRAYKAMLEKINFNREDMLYILGDILDRGPNPIRIILDLMERFNVEVIAGNHYVMACECLAFLTKEITSESIAEIDEEMIQKLLSWQQNGGISTTDEFHKCSREMQREIVDFISDFELYDEIEVNGQKFVLVHAGLGNFMPNKELWKYELNDLIWERPDCEKCYYSDKFVITGHTPTMLIENNPRPGYIYKKNNHIAIDCGCGFRGGRLGCLRLEDMEEFYVDSEE